MEFVRKILRFAQNDMPEDCFAFRNILPFSVRRLLVRLSAVVWFVPHYFIIVANKTKISQNKGKADTI